MHSRGGDHNRHNRGNPVLRPVADDVRAGVKLVAHEDEKGNGALHMIELKVDSKSFRPLL